MAKAPKRVVVEVEVANAEAPLGGFLSASAEPLGLVIFAHGSGSSRFSSRRQYVAQVLNDAGLATLLLDLLTPAESQADERTRQYRFNVKLLSERVTGAIDWAEARGQTRKWPVGLFGASTGAAAALLAAMARPNRVRAIVARGGRPDLAGEVLQYVAAPTLLIVGGLDAEVIEFNRRAAERMRAASALEIVPGATHLFEEPGTLELAANLARDWFVNHLTARVC